MKRSETIIMGMNGRPSLQRKERLLDEVIRLFKEHKRNGLTRDQTMGRINQMKKNNRFRNIEDIL
jgi:hypothetical protein